VNPIRDAPLLTASAGVTPAAVIHESQKPWPGLSTAADQIGVPLGVTALAQLDRYRDLLLDRNAHVNLTAITDPIEVERRLFLDALAMIPAIDRFLELRHRSATNQVRLIDVGSGAGFPGLVVKIARPDIQVTLLDATAKKVAFMSDVIREMQLDGAEAVHGRAEELARSPQFREVFDLGTARAVATLPVLLEYVLPFLDIGGEALLPKGLDLDAELVLGRRAARLLGATILAADRLPHSNTRLVIAQKTTLTGKTYPRRTGIPSRSPLGAGV
jgi:16S rRNA (guanine527-N7)-methyltransferase